MPKAQKVVGLIPTHSPRTSTSNRQAMTASQTCRPTMRRNSPPRVPGGAPSRRLGSAKNPWGTWWLSELPWSLTCRSCVGSSSSAARDGSGSKLPKRRRAGRATVGTGLRALGVCERRFGLALPEVAAVVVPVLQPLVIASGELHDQGCEVRGVPHGFEGAQSTSDFLPGLTAACPTGCS